MTALRPTHFRLLAALIMALGASSHAQGQNRDLPQFIGIDVGLDGRYVAGTWSQVEIQVRCGRIPMTVIPQLATADGDGVRSTVSSPRPYALIPGQVTPVRLFVKPGRIDPTFIATLARIDDNSGDAVAEKSFDARMLADAMHPALAMTPTQALAVNVGGATTIAPAGSASASSLDESMIVARLDSADRLPTRWYGYDGVSAVIIATSQPQALRALSAASAQLTALEEWVRLGGTLLISVGQSAPEVLAPGAPLARFAPGDFSRMAPLRQLRELETYAGATEPVSIPISEPAEGRPAEARLDVPQLTGVRGRVDVREGEDLPLVIRTPYGLGEVIFVAVDLDRAPLARWNDRAKLVRRLLQLPDLSSADSDPNATYSGNQYNQMVIHLAHALDEFTGVKVAPFSLVALLIGVYVLLIGPIDYWIVKKLFKRMELTWVTFPLMVAAVSLGAYLLASWMKGDRLLVNQAQVVDVDLETGLVRGAEWINVFSPAVSRYDVTAVPAFPDGRPADDARKLISWMATPEIDYGGPEGSSLLNRGYSFAPKLDAMLRVPIQFWSTKAFSARWHVTEPGCADWLDIELSRTRQGALRGQLTNRLPITLDDCALIYGRDIYPLGELAPQAEAAVEPAQRRELRSHFETEAQQGDAAAAILPRMMFRAALSTAKKEPGQGPRQPIDMSDLLSLGRAILLVRVGQDELNLRLDDHPAPAEGSRRWTYYRFVIPIDSNDSD